MDRKKILIPIIIFTAIVISLIVVLNLGTRYNKLAISESKWNSIKDTRSENENLVLEDIEFNDYKLIIDENNNTIYYSAVNDSKNKYNPNVSYSTNIKNAKLAFFTDEITEEKVKSDYKFKIMIYDDKEYHIYNLICTDLPILNIRYKEEAENKQKSIPMEIYVFNNLANTPNKITVSSGKFKINEDNYTFSLNMMTPGKNMRDNKISILNMKPNSEYILTALNNGEEDKQENTEENTENTNSTEPKNHRVELFINNEYKGIYSLGYVQKENKK